jgi:hypothetical protein
MLQADPKVKAAAAKPTAKPGAAPATGGAGAFGAMAGQLAKGGAEQPNNMANAPVSKTNTAKPGNPNAAAANPEQDAVDAKNAASGMAPDEIAKQRTDREARVASRPAPGAAAPADAAGGKLTPQQVAAKTAELKGKRAAGKTTGTAASGFKQYTKDASSQRIVGANRDGSPKIQQIKASKINSGNIVAEGFTFYRTK